MKKEALKRQTNNNPIKKIKLENKNEIINNLTNQIMINNQTPQSESTEDLDQGEENLTQKYRLLGLPITFEATLRGHERPLSCIAIEKKGTRMVTGSWDSDVRMWDFYGMDKSMNSFRILTPIEDHVVQNISYNHDEQEILVVSACAQPKIISREGKELVECLRGDTYLRDLKNTKGHTHMCYDGTFHPTESNKFITSGQDGTIRIWDRFRPLWGLEQKQKQADVIVCNLQGKKVFSCNYMRDGNMAVGACSDGTIKCYDLKGSFLRPNIHFLNAHQPEVLTTKVISFIDGFRLLSRAQDNTMKLWDARNPKEVVHIWNHLENNLVGTKMCLSPDEKYILTGTSYNRETEKQGMLKIYDSTTYEQKASLGMGQVGVCEVKWSKPINQIFCGLTDGSCQTLFDTQLSNKGVVSCLAKQERVYTPIEYTNAMVIKTPHALPLFKDEKINKKRDYEKMRTDVKQSHEPLRPPPVRSTGGRMGGPSTVTQHILQSANERFDVGQDPQRALQALDAIARKGPQLVNSAYALTQPKTIFDMDAQDYEENKYLNSLREICGKCGLKLCTCNIDPCDIK